MNISTIPEPLRPESSNRSPEYEKRSHTPTLRPKQNSITLVSPNSSKRKLFMRKYTQPSPKRNENGRAFGILKNQKRDSSPLISRSKPIHISSRLQRHSFNMTTQNAMDKMNSQNGSVSPNHNSKEGSNRYFVPSGIRHMPHSKSVINMNNHSVNGSQRLVNDSITTDHHHNHLQQQQEERRVQNNHNLIQISGSPPKQGQPSTQISLRMSPPALNFNEHGSIVETTVTPNNVTHVQLRSPSSSNNNNTNQSSRFLTRNGTAKSSISIIKPEGAIDYRRLPGAISHIKYDNIGSQSQSFTRNSINSSQKNLIKYNDTKNDRYRNPYEENRRLTGTKIIQTPILPQPIQTSTLTSTTIIENPHNQMEVSDLRKELEIAKRQINSFSSQIQQLKNTQLTQSGVMRREVAFSRDYIKDIEDLNEQGKQMEVDLSDAISTIKEQQFEIDVLKQKTTLNSNEGISEQKEILQDKISSQDEVISKLRARIDTFEGQESY